MIAKPNYEGSSKGIGASSVAETRAELEALVGDLLVRFPDGVLVETFVEGVDVSVGWIDGVGWLAPISYAYEPSNGRYAVFDLALKRDARGVRALVPAPLDDDVTTRLDEAARYAFAALDVTGYGRADFRVTPDGDVFFLEMNPLPTLAPSDDEIYRAAAAVGATPREMLAAIVTSPLRACRRRRTSSDRRFGICPTHRSRTGRTA